MRLLGKGFSGLKRTTKVFFSFVENSELNTQLLPPHFEEELVEF